MKKRLALLLSVVLVCAMLLPLLAACDSLGSKEWYYRESGDIIYYISIDERNGEMVVLVEHEESAVSYTFDCSIDDETVELKDTAKNKEKYSFKEKSGSYIVINDVKFKATDVAPKDYTDGDGDLTLYKLFGHPDSEGSVTTDPDSKTTEEILETETAPHWEETTKGPIDYDSREPIATTDDEYLGSIPEIDWRGYTFRIYYTTLNNAQTDFVCNNELSGVVLNDRVYKRNTEVEKRLNIKIETVPHAIPYETVLQTQYAAGYTEGDFDMVTGAGHSSVLVGTKGYVANLVQYENINLKKPYWDQGFVDSMMTGGALYSVLGDYSVQGNLATSSICFNKNLLHNPEELYEAVYSYKWTVEMMLDYMDEFAADTNKDGDYDQSTDLFGISGLGTESGYSIFYGSGFSFCENDGSTLRLEYDERTFNDIMDLTLKLWTHEGAYYIDPNQASQNFMPFEIFSSGRGLFCDIPLYKIGEYFADMEDDYGILPEPRYHTEQERYSSFVSYNVPMLLIPRNDPNSARTGHIVETICVASHDIIKNYHLYEITTKIQIKHNAYDENMLGIILDSKTFDPAYWLNLSGYGTISRALTKEKQNISESYLMFYGNKAKAELEDCMTCFGKYKNN